MQDASLDIWDKKYRLKDKNEQPVDEDINATYMRVAKALSDVEAKTSAKSGRKTLSGHFSMAPFRLAALSPMPALRHTSPPPQLLTAPCPALFPTPCRAFWNATWKLA